MVAARPLELAARQSFARPQKTKLSQRLRATFHTARLAAPTKAMRRRERAVAWAYALGSILWLGTALLLVKATPSRATATASAPANASSVKALSRMRDATWAKRYAAISASAAAGQHDIVFLGDSITQGLENSKALRPYAHLNILNAGIASDRVEHLLWRIRHGNFPVAAPRQVVLMIGINNLAVSTPEYIAAGVQAILTELKTRAPSTPVLLLGLLPSGQEVDHPRRAKIKAVNQQLRKLASKQVTYADIGSRFLAADGSIAKSTMSDFLHPTRSGYLSYAQAIQPYLSPLLNK